MNRFTPLVIWAVMSTITASGTLRSLESLEYYHDVLCKSYRIDLSMAIGLSMLPPTWIVAPFMTGFYAHGFGFSQPKECK
jgi:hypothetical protein